MMPILAVDNATDAVPYVWVAILVGAMATAIVVLFKLLMASWKREQDRADALAKLVNSWAVEARESEHNGKGDHPEET